MVKSYLYVEVEILFLTPIQISTGQQNMQVTIKGSQWRDVKWANTAEITVNV